MKVIDKVKEVLTPKAQQDWFDEPNDNSNYDPIEPDNSRWELEYDDVISRYEHTLRNERKNSKGNWEKIEGTSARMNEKGIAYTVSQLRCIMHKGIALGNIKEEYAKNMAQQLAHAYRVKLILDYEEYGIEKTDLPSLILSYLNQVYLILTKPINDGERKIRLRRFPSQETYRHDEVSADELRGGLKL